MYKNNFRINTVVPADRLFTDRIDLSSALPPCWWRAGDQGRTGEVTLQSSLREADREKEIERGRWLAAKGGVQLGMPLHTVNKGNMCHTLHPTLSSMMKINLPGFFSLK